MSEPEDKTDLLPQAPAADEPARSPAVAPVVVPRWIQLVAVILGGLAVYAIVTAAGPVLLLFITAAIIALILNPVVATLQRARVPRGLAILVVYAGFFATLAFVGTLLANRPSATTCRRSCARRTTGSPTCRTTSTARTSTSRSRSRARPRSARSSSASSAGPTRWCRSAPTS
jgi:hypothetical protein